jgi:hypothetical protein
MKKLLFIFLFFVSGQAVGQNITFTDVNTIHQYFLEKELFPSELIKVAHDSIFSTLFQQQQNISKQTYFGAMKNASVALLPEVLRGKLKDIPQNPNGEKNAVWVAPVSNTYGSVWINVPATNSENNQNSLKILKDYQKHGFINRKEFKKLRKKLSTTSII